MKRPSQKTVRILLILALCYSLGKMLLPYVTPKKILYGSLERDVIEELVLKRFESSVILSSAGDGLVQESLSFLADEDLSATPFNRSLTLKIPGFTGLRDISYQDISISRLNNIGERSDIAMTQKTLGASLEVDPADLKALYFAKGKNQYQVSYTIKNALESDATRRRFVWNVLSRHFVIQTSTLSGSIAFPRGVKRELVEIRSIAYGMNEAGRQARIDNFLAGQGENFLIFDRSQPLSESGNDFITFNSPRPLVPGELVLISADWPTAAEPSQQTSAVTEQEALEPEPEADSD
jgi:hypothetical protein